MGGPGSGRWGAYTPKTTVEACRVLSLTRWRQEGALQPGQRRTGRWTWVAPATGIQTATLEYVVDLINMDRPVVWLTYTNPRAPAPLAYPVHLEMTWPPFGGCRWWMRCPLVVAGQPCRRRVARLYLPPAGRYFGCRFCHDLTYESSQTSHQYARALAPIARALGSEMSGDAVARLVFPRRR